MKPREKIVVFGFGSQGRAQSLNLKDSGMDVTVALRPKSSLIPDVKKNRIPLVTDLRRAARMADIAAVLIPDGKQPALYKNVLENNLPKGSALVFAHGLAIHYKRIVPRDDIDVILVAPLAHANAVRENYAGGGAPMLLAVAQDATGRAKERAFRYARAISPKGRVIKTTFREEVETDLFAEQAVLCGGMPELVRAAFDTLVSAGYDREIAYLSCLKELKPIVALLDAHGIAGLRKRISDTARYGALSRGGRVIGKRTRGELHRILKEIRSGEFAKEIFGGGEKSARLLKKLSRLDETHAIERIHKKLARG